MYQALDFCSNTKVNVMDFTLVYTNMNMLIFYKNESNKQNMKSLKHNI